MTEGSSHTTFRDLYIVFLLSMAGIVTSWSSFQAALWDGDQNALYTEATALRMESTRASDTAGQLVGIDIELFSQWLDASAQNKTKLAEFYRARFRPEFVPVFNAWLASDPVNNLQTTPFAGYVPEAQKKAQELEAQAAELFQKGQEANRRSDNFVKNTTVLAIVMFFAGIAQQIKKPKPQFILLAIATGMMVLSMLNLIRYAVR